MVGDKIPTEKPGMLEESCDSALERSLTVCYLTGACYSGCTTHPAYLSAAILLKHCLPFLYRSSIKSFEVSLP
jgi:hypothetical protein